MTDLSILTKQISDSDIKNEIKPPLNNAELNIAIAVYAARFRLLDEQMRVIAKALDEIKIFKNVGV